MSRRSEAAQELLRRRAARSSLLDFTRYTFPRYQADPFHVHLCGKLDKFVADCRAKKAPRLMVFAPPRHGKSQLVSRQLPAFAMGLEPDESIIATSYSSDLSSSLNRDVQRIMDAPEYLRLFPNTNLFGANVRTVAQGSYLRNSDIFEIVGRRGYYLSAGVGGGITGRGFSLMGILDDPFKDAAEAYSETIRKSKWEWFETTFETRSEEGAGILLTNTRWHLHDLSGKIIEQMRTLGNQEWEILSYPAIADVDDEFRKAGECLAPSRRSLESLLKLKTKLSAPVWASLYQQSPTIAGGNIINVNQFKRYSALPFEPRMVVWSWDTGTKAKEYNNPTAGECWHVTDQGHYLAKVVRRRMEYPELKRTVVNCARESKHHAILIEDKGSGQSLIQDLRSETNLPIIAVEPCGDKVTRMLTETPAIESGRVFLPAFAPWLVDFETECSAFPNAGTDDQVDAFSQFLCYIRKKFFKMDFPAPSDFLGGGAQRDYLGGLE